MRLPHKPIVCAGLFLAISWTAQAQQASTPAEAILAGTPILDLRARYENADQDGKETGEATTLQTLFGWRTKPIWNTSLTFEGINVGRLNDDYNDGQNGKIQFPVIGDPDDTDVNQLYLDWTGLPETRFRGGRQVVKLDNVRFIGNVAFRQVLQVFNGITVENKSLPGTRLFLGYVGRVKTVDTREHESDTILLNANYALSADKSLVGYGYFQDQYDAIGGAGFSAPPPADTSNQIIGIRLDGAHALAEPWKLLFTVEYAMQNDYADGDSRIDAHYLRLGIGGSWGDFFLRVDREQLSSNDGTYGFQTPLATRHPYQGWADQFLTTPPQGLRDTYLSAGAKIEKAELVAEYHRFKSDVGGIDFGEEFDFGVSYPLMQKLTGRFEYADYQAGDIVSGKVDLRRLWLTLVYSY